MWELKFFWYYIYEQQIVMYTNHSVFISLKTKKDELIGKLGQWMLKLQKYNIDIWHRSGKIHINIDVLSRMDDNGVLYKIKNAAVKSLKHPYTDK
jgi:hypothetical protein